MRLSFAPREPRFAQRGTITKRSRSVLKGFHGRAFVGLVGAVTKQIVNGKLYVVTEFVFSGGDAATVFVRNVSFSNAPK